MNDRKSLSDILGNNGKTDLSKLWGETEAAAEFAPIPAGTYLARLLSGELFTAEKKGTPGYKIVGEITEGEYTDRRIFIDFWLTGKALPMAKRDLAKLGINDPSQLERPLPPGMLVKVKLSVRKDDDGKERNKVITFDYIGIEPGDAFEPPLPTITDTPATNGAPTASKANLDFLFGTSAQAEQSGKDFLDGERGIKS